MLTPRRIVSIGSQGHILTTQEPKEDHTLPVNDSAWVRAELELAKFHTNNLTRTRETYRRLCRESFPARFLNLWTHFLDYAKHLL
jgi:hypothetical protein